MKLLVANRGEIAIRIMRAAAELDIPTVAVYPQDDAGSLHTGKADEAVVLPGIGRNAYLDIDEIIAAAKGSDCDAIHPGCGFLAEDAEFARRCDQASLTFIGPPAGVLDLLGDNERMQAAAIAADLAVQQDNPDVQPVRRLAVQILADLHADIIQLGDRDCSVPGIDIAPAPSIDQDLRERMQAAAVRLMQHIGYSGVGCVEFLLDEDFVFAGAMGSLQVAHTVTEALTGVDIVKTQLQVFSGASLRELGLDEPQNSSGYAIQARVCLEAVREDGAIHPTSGTLLAYEAPSGPGIRTDGFGYGGYETSLLYDSLLAKVIAYSNTPRFSDVISRTLRALSEFRIEGPDTNLAFLMSILSHQAFAAGAVHTGFIEEEMSTLVANMKDQQARTEPVVGMRASANLGLGDSQDLPLGPDGSIGLATPMQGTLVGIDVNLSDEVRVGQTVAVVEAMKLQHDIKADRSGIVVEISMSVGDVVQEGYPIVFINETNVEGGALETEGGIDLDALREDMREFNDYIAYTLDDQHGEAVSARHDAGRRTPRENLDDFIDDNSFRELGPAVSGSAEGGAIIGFGSVNGELFGEEGSRVALIYNDYDVTTRTNGAGHYKQEPIHELVKDFKVPLVLFSEGEGKPFIARKGFPTGVGMDEQLFSEFAKLSGLVPLVGITTGHSFGANATMLACCDVIIATRNAAVGMGGGPSVVAAVGMGEHSAEDIGSMSFQVPNGNVDILVEDDAAAVATARKYLSYFQGRVDTWEAPDQRRMRHIIPENRVRTYDMREIVETLADEGSVLEIRKDFGIGVITSLIRVEGRPMGLVANNPAHLAGAVDSQGADKGARFLQLCDAFDLPVVVFMDCPGIMVGPDHEREALVRHAVRMFNVGANLSTAMFGVMVRKAYGLGVQAMCGGSAMIPFFNVAWPTAEFAGMNIDGAVKLSARRELAAIEDPEERKAAYDRRVADGYETARAVNSGARYVIDPAETRAWIAQGLKSLPPVVPRAGKKRPYIDTW